MTDSAPTTLTFTLKELAEKCGATLPDKYADKAEMELTGLAPLHEASPDQLSFLDNPRYAAYAQHTTAGAVFVREKMVPNISNKTIELITPEPYIAFAKAMQMFHPLPEVQGGISKLAIVSNQATVHPSARLEPGCVVYAGADIGAKAFVGGYTIIGEGVKIGAHTRVYPHATIENATIGQHGIINSGVRIGQDGFGFANDGNANIKIPQMGRVVIGHNVEIGANTCIDRGALNNTIIGDGVKIDNMVQIGHNAEIGDHVRIVSQVGIAGSAKIGAHSVIGGQAGVAGHITLAERTMVGGKSGVVKTVKEEGTTIMGTPAIPAPDWRRLQAVLGRAVKSVQAGRMQRKKARAEEVEGDIPPENLVGEEEGSLL